MKIRNVNPNFHDSIGCGQKNDAEVTLILLACHHILRDLFWLREATYLLAGSPANWV